MSNESTEGASQKQNKLVHKLRLKKVKKSLILNNVEPIVYLITRARKVYLKFWASWCSICLASLPDTDEIAKEAGDDYVVLTVVSPGHKGAI